MKTYFIQLFSGLVIILLLSSTSCKTEGTASAPDPIFLKCWAHGFEEETPDNSLVFRSCMNHTFPIARYRNTFTLKENGEVDYTVLASNDAHSTEAGKWSYDAKTKKLRISNKENVVVHEYEVLEMSEDMLRLKE